MINFMNLNIIKVNMNTLIQLRLKKRLVIFRKKAWCAREKIRKSLENLEEKIKPYIQFETIKGWTFF